MKSLYYHRCQWIFIRLKTKDFDACISYLVIVVEIKDDII